MQKYFLLFFLSLSISAHAQVNGGEHVFEFLRLPQSPHLSAIGGMNVTNPSADVMMSTSNPALLRPSFHTSLGVNYNMYYAGTKVSNVLYVHQSKKLNTTFGLGIQHLNYGTFVLADDAGNNQGEGKATDYSINATASKSYLEKWRYGATLKFANSHLIDKKARALLADIGVLFADTNSQWYAGAVVKNAGIIIKNYEKDIKQPLPMDLQIGLTKKFKRAPFSLMLLAHHLYEWDIRYDNPADATDNTLLFTDSSSIVKKNYFADKLFRHFVFALEINLGKHLELSVGYNHMRRSELSIAEKKGMAGFSFGGGLYLNKFVLHFAQSYYHLAGPYTEMGINFKLNQLLGFGSSGNKINWAEKYANEYK